METLKIKIIGSAQNPPKETEVKLPHYRKSRIGIYRLRVSRKNETLHNSPGIACDGIITNDLFLEMSCSHNPSLALRPDTTEATEADWIKAKNEVLTKLSNIL